MRCLLSSALANSRRETVTTKGLEKVFGRDHFRMVIFEAYGGHGGQGIMGSCTLHTRSFI